MCKLILEMLEERFGVIAHPESGQWIKKEDGTGHTLTKDETAAIHEIIDELPRWRINDA